MSGKIILAPEVVEEIVKRRKVRAIKMIREAKGISLVDAKAIVDQYCLENDIQYSQEGRGGLSLSTLAIIVIIVVGVVMIVGNSK